MFELRSGHFKLGEVQDIHKVVKREMDTEIYFEH